MLDIISLIFTRSQMSIIPQEPFLFDDTVSRNLDPKDEYTNEEKLDVLEKCHLSKAIQDLGKQCQ